MKMRDDFIKPVVEALAKRVGFVCSNPSCEQLTVGPQEETSGTITIGVAAHITAAAPGGPRYDPALSSDERRSITNELLSNVVDRAVMNQAASLGACPRN